nr:site-specific integrase [Asticcacaulis currens]
MDRFLNAQEFGRLGCPIDQSRKESPAHAAALMLLLLTGCRKNEIVGLKWREVRGSRIYLDDSKTGARTVFVCTQGRDILANIKRGKASELVFKGQYGSRIDIDNYWQTIRRKANLGVIRLHDIRHSYASQAARLSLPLPTIQRLLGHAQLESTARYTHFDDSHLADAVQNVSDLIAAACAIATSAKNKWSDAVPVAD